MDPWPSWVVGAIRSELAYNAAKRTISVWLPERIVWGDDCIKTFNRTCKNVLFNPSQKTGSQMVGIDKDGKPGTHLLLKEAGRASNLSIFTFKDANGKKAKDNSTADHLSKSIGGYIKENFDGKGDEVNIYGISVMNGYHSMMVTYNKDKNGNDVFNLFDQGPATSLLDGNSTFSSAEDLDTAINTYVKDRQDKKTKKGHQYPATVEIFKIEADGCID
jgi:hypothetical protein